MILRSSIALATLRRYLIRIRLIRRSQMCIPLLRLQRKKKRADHVDAQKHGSIEVVPGLVVFVPHQQLPRIEFKITDAAFGDLVEIASGFKFRTLAPTVQCVPVVKNMAPSDPNRTDIIKKVLH